MHYVVDLQIEPYANVLKALRQSSARPKLILESVGESLLNANPDRHSQNLDPDGQAWVPLTKSTLYRAVEAKQHRVTSSGNKKRGAMSSISAGQKIMTNRAERMTSDLALNALLMAVWRRKPKSEVMVHSDQGSQFSSYDWQDFLKSNNLLGSMSRRGNCHDNAVAESFFQLLKRERIKRKTYTTREEARQDVFDYIEMFYNPKRRHSHANDLSPVEYEKQYFLRLGSV